MLATATVVPTVSKCGGRHWSKKSGALTNDFGKNTGIDYGVEYYYSAFHVIQQENYSRFWKHIWSGIKSLQATGQKETGV